MRRWLKPFLIATGCLSGAALVGFDLFLLDIFSFDPKAQVSGDAIVVLTGGEARVHEALRLFATGEAGRRVLISGVNTTTSRDELWRHSNIPPVLFDCCVDIGHRARDTAGNAAETRDWVEPWGFKRLVVVTSNYHMPRSLLVLHRAMPGIELIPHAVVSQRFKPATWWRSPSSIRLVATEYVKSLTAAAELALSTRQPSPPREPPSHPAPTHVSSSQAAPGL